MESDRSRKDFNRAIALAKSSSEHNAAVTQLKWQGAINQVTNRDVLDVVNFGDWRGARQHDHFMRRSQGQTSEEACEESIDSIEDNAV